MMGVRAVFYEIDLRVHDTVRFGDGSVANIEGCGSILVKCKTGGHKALTGVYYIPRLTASANWRRPHTRLCCTTASSDYGIVPGCWLPR
jgi:hypothetical protein